MSPRRQPVLNTKREHKQSSRYAETFSNDAENAQITRYSLRGQDEELGPCCSFWYQLSVWHEAKMRGLNFGPRSEGGKKSGV
jgi:hypothetical protein